MTLQQARRVLNCVRDGHEDVHPHLIRHALRVTGDLGWHLQLEPKPQPVATHAWPFYALTANGAQPHAD